MLREHGFSSDHGFLYFAGSKERVRVTFDDELVKETMGAIDRLRQISLQDIPPLPLIDSPKCPRCSLMGICLPDEIGFLTHGLGEIRAVYARTEDAPPLYVQAAGSYIRKNGGQLIIEIKQVSMKANA